MIVALLVATASSCAFVERADPAQLAEHYAAAVERVNKEHAQKPVAKDEAELAKKLPPAAAQDVEALTSCADSPATRAALARAAEAALELDRLADFDVLSARLAKLAPDDAKKLGVALSRPRFVARGRDGVTAEGLRALADAFDLALDGYADLFGFTNFSKLAGKKLRLDAHLVPKITAPPHFAPEFPYHSQIDFPVIEPAKFESPTAEGQFLFYGLCHELGHVLAMWGDARNEADHHAWAHYTGVAVVEHLSKTRGMDPALRGVRDVKWRSLTSEREELAEKKTPPGMHDRASALALFVELHALLGPKVIGEALNALDAADTNLRINRVRYYDFAEFQRALGATKTGKKNKQKLDARFTMK